MPDPAQTEHRTPEIGDVWEDMDPRGGPRFTIVAFNGDRSKAYVANTSGAERRRWISTHRLRPSRRGYRFVENVHV